MDGERAAVGRLVVCPTPIGDLRDVTLRVLDVLREADAIACEDTRRTGTLLDAHGARSAQTKLISLHEHNERERVASLLRMIESGQTVALVSDAGMPLISDPGYPLLSAAIEAGLRVQVLPGASAALVALLASGLPPSSFRFVGFLPRSRGDLERTWMADSETLVAFESPRRVAASLAVLAELDPKRRVAVCRELTKVHEQVIRGSAAELAARYAQERPLGEVVIVAEGARAERADLLDAIQSLKDLIDAGAKPRAAAKAIAKLTGLSANELYERAAAR